MDAAIKTLATILHSRVAPSTSMEILDVVERMRQKAGASPEHVFQLVEPTLSMYRSKPPAVTPFSLGMSRVILETSCWRLSRMKVSLGNQVRGFEENRRRRIINAVIQCKSTMDAEFLFAEAIASELVQSRALVFGENHKRDDRRPLQELHHEAIGEAMRLREIVPVAAPAALVREPRGIIWALGAPPASFDDEWSPDGCTFFPFDPGRPSYRLDERSGLERFLIDAGLRINPWTVSHLIHWMLQPWPAGTSIVGFGTTEDADRCVCPDDAHPIFVQWAQKEEEGAWDGMFDPSALTLILKLPDGKVQRITYCRPEGGRLASLGVGSARVPEPRDDTRILWES